MNRLKSNINLTLNKQNIKANNEPAVVKGKELLASTQIKKKRTALENISNAASVNKEDTSKKSRFSNQVFGLVGLKKETTIHKKISASKENLDTLNSQKGGCAGGKSSASSTTSSTQCKPTAFKELDKNSIKLVESKKQTTTTTSSIPQKIPIDTTTNKTRLASSSSVGSCSSLVCNYEKLELSEKEAKKVELSAEEVEGWDDIDAEDVKDEFSSSDYVNQIFRYYKKRESQFVVSDYLKHQPQLNKSMRLLLVDWMVEVQQQLEFNHEVLYLSVKLLDLFLSNRKIDKDKLQLVGGTAMFIACKFEERIPPVIDDFIYVSDNAYDRNDLLKTEIDILKTLRFDIGAPLSYTFLRRYSKCLRADMKFLTLARYILELALQDYAFCYLSESLKACAALYLAMKMAIVHEQKLPISSRTNLAYNKWTPTLIHYTGYFFKDFSELIPSMNELIKNALFSKHKTIYKKYSHQVFYEVAKISHLSETDLETFIKEDLNYQH